MDLFAAHCLFSNRPLFLLEQAEKEITYIYKKGMVKMQYNRGAKPLSTIRHLPGIPIFLMTHCI
jgi:hypothetical protein